ncbi:hypothetical protein [Rhizobium leguminosarum]|uniref:hypothetical protein n=1 Tax=Rhizobium leguminosarum TaxID=384 RepID=UPI0021BC11A5|nr:hypothetical protein [Rhizobium leguminosarum]
MTTPFQVSFDLLPSSGHLSTFSPKGVGEFLSDSFNADLLAKRLQFPILTRGRTLLLVADFGGHHQKQHFDTYTFLILDLAKNQNWLAHQRRVARQMRCQHYILRLVNRRARRCSTWH